MPGDGPLLSLVIPAYDEAERLPRALQDPLRYLRAQVASFEIVVVDDGSRDGTAEAAREALAAQGAAEHTRVISFPRNRGKGAAVREGMLAASGRYALFSDADFSTPIEEEARLRTALEQGADVAIGSRAHPAARLEVRQERHREALGKGFNALVRALGLSRLRDTQCGFKMFTRDAARAIFGAVRSDRFAFDVEVLLLAERAGLRIAEIPVAWRNDPRSHVHLRDAPKILLELLRIRLRYARPSSGRIRARSASTSSTATERERDGSGGPA